MVEAGVRQCAKEHAMKIYVATMGHVARNFARRNPELALRFKVRPVEGGVGA